MLMVPMLEGPGLSPKSPIMELLHHVSVFLQSTPTARNLAVSLHE